MKKADYWIKNLDMVSHPSFCSKHKNQSDPTHWYYGIFLCQAFCIKVLWNVMKYSIINEGRDRYVSKEK